VNPVFAFAFLDSFLDTLADYLGGEITEGALRDNFDIVYMVGNTLEDIILTVC
jgi:AP-3 complex subunit mu